MLSNRLWNKACQDRTGKHSISMHTFRVHNEKKTKHLLFLTKIITIVAAMAKSMDNIKGHSGSFFCIQVEERCISGHLRTKQSIHPHPAQPLRQTGEGTWDNSVWHFHTLLLRQLMNSLVTLHTHSLAEAGWGFYEGGSDTLTPWMSACPITFKKSLVGQSWCPPHATRATNKNANDYSI